MMRNIEVTGALIMVLSSIPVFSSIRLLRATRFATDSLLGAKKHLYKWVCPSGRPSVRPFVRLSVRSCFRPSVGRSVRRSVHLSVRPFVGRSVRPSVGLSVLLSVGSSICRSVRYAFSFSAISTCFLAPRGQYWLVFPLLSVFVNQHGEHHSP